MKWYKVSVVRERLADVLDEVERGVPVFIERRDVTYRLSVEPRKGKRRTRKASTIEILDPAVEQGDWSWSWAPEGLTFDKSRS